MTPEHRKTDPERVARFVATDPAVRSISRASGDAALYLVGGSVRDLLIGLDPAELDFVVEGAIDDIAQAVDSDARIYPRFGTAEISVGGTPVDLARARSEIYSAPGALPEVVPADLTADLGRRDFTINAMAFRVQGVPELLDPFDGRSDLENGILRILHGGSFLDDPTRAMRAARYCSRLDLEPDPITLSALQLADLSSVSRERLARELDLIAHEACAARALGLLGSWGLIDVDPESIQVAEDAFRLVRSEPWNGICSETELAKGLISRAAIQAAAELADPPTGAWERYLVCRGTDPATLVIARARGVEWLDRWPGEWAVAQLEIGGEDLVDAGIPEGPPVGAGLEAALRDRIEGGITSRERQLDVALEGARRALEG